MSTPYMSLNLPIPGTTPGPDYATENNAAFTVIDSHDHTSGKGVQVPTAGLNINADLTFGGYNATSLRSVRMSSQASPLSLSSDLGCLYVSNGNLYYNNTSGQQVQITLGSGLNLSSTGGFSGNYGTGGSTAIYNSASTTYSFTLDGTNLANVNTGALKIYATNTSNYGVSLQAPSLSASYSMTLPTALPASTKILTVDASGNIGDAYDVDNSSLQVSSNTISIKNQGVTQGMLALRGTGTSVSAGGVAMSTSCGTASTNSASFSQITNFSVSITTTGRPVVITIIPDGTISTQAGTFSTISNTNMGLKLQNGGVDVCQTHFGATATSGTITVDAPVSIFYYLDTPAAGTQTYSLLWSSNGTATQFIHNAKLIAYEL